MNVLSDTKPLPPPALPWTDRYLRWTSAETRRRVQVASELIPRRSDLRSVRSYVHGTRIHWALFAEDFTMVYPIRGRTLYRLARHADRDALAGALVDCGTYNGGSTALLSAGAPRRAIWAFDSFEGLPAPSQRDSNDADFDVDEAREFFKGKCLGSQERLEEAVARFGSLDKLHVRKGWFQDTLPIASNEIGPIAVLHIDGDWYDSIYTVLNNLYGFVVPGGYIAVDDYAGVPGAGRATEDFKRQVGDDTVVTRIDQSGAYWRKPS